MTVQTDVTTKDLVHKTISNPSGSASEDLLRLLIDNIKEHAITTLDPRGHVITWTPAAERLKGYRSDEILGKHFSTFYPREDINDGKCERELEAATRDGRFEDEAGAFAKMEPNSGPTW
jgi:PAS domain S-box-containing protein